MADQTDPQALLDEAVCEACVAGGEYALELIEAELIKENLDEGS